MPYCPRNVIVLTHRQHSIHCNRLGFQRDSKADGLARPNRNTGSLTCSLGGRFRVIVVASLWLLLSGFVAPLPAAAEDLEAARSISSNEFDAILMAWFAPLPRSASVEIFTTFDRPKRSREEWEKDIRKSFDQQRASGQTFTDDELENLIRLNVEGNMKIEATPKLTRERYLRLDDALRLDSVDSGILEPVSPATPFKETTVQPGDLQKGDTRKYVYFHPNPRPQSEWPATSAWRTVTGSAFRGTCQ